MWLGANCSHLTFRYFQIFPPFRWIKTWLEMQCRLSMTGRPWVSESLTFLDPWFLCGPNRASSRQVIGKNPISDLNYNSNERSKRAWLQSGHSMSTSEERVCVCGEECAGREGTQGQTLMSSPCRESAPPLPRTVHLQCWQCPVLKRVHLT